MANAKDIKGASDKNQTPAPLKPAEVPAAATSDEKPAQPAAPSNPAPAVKAALPVPSTGLDLSDEAAKRLEEYKATIFQQALQDKIQGAFNADGATVASFAGLVAALIDKNGQPALDALSSMKLADLMPTAKKAASDGESKPREKAAELTEEQTAAAKTAITEALSKAGDAGLTVGECAKAINGSSATAKAIIDALKTDGKCVQTGEARATRYHTKKDAPAEAPKQPALPIQ